MSSPLDMLCLARSKDRNLGGDLGENKGKVKKSICIASG